MFNKKEKIKAVGYVKPIDKEETISQETHFANLLNEMFETFKAKNADYGNSFDESLNEHGLLASKIRIGDKFNRFKTIISKGIKVTNETIRDTLLDMANYCILTVMWLERNKK